MYNVGDVIIPQKYVVDITQFGAIPNDSKDDSEAIQRAIDHAIHSKESSVVYCPAGVYKLSSGVIIKNQQSSGEYRHVTLTLTGPAPAYSADQRIGSVAVFEVGKNNFGVGVHKGRNCSIQNIVFKGQTIYRANQAELLGFGPNSWEDIPVRKNKNSPEAAIVIDPFHKSTSDRDKYPGFERFYSNNSGGGSSMIKISGCSFSNFYIALANNPSSGVSNGDNIVAKNCHVASCYTFWSSGQPQSRANEMSNIYATYIHTFISGNQIGRQHGTPPFVNNINIAGGCKYLAFLRSGFTGAHFNQCYMESIWSLGVFNVNHTSFDNCQIKFMNPDGRHYIPDFHLFSNNPVSFSNSSLEYFNNCKNPIALNLYCEHLTILGGHIEAGVVMPNGITNNGGDEIHNIDVNNTVLRCQNSTAIKNRIGMVEAKLANHVMINNSRFQTSKKEVYENNSTTYRLDYIEKARLTVDAIHKTAKFQTSNPGAYRVGDNLFSPETISIDFGYLTKLQIRTCLGYVSAVNGKEVTLSGINSMINDKNYQIYLGEYARFYPEIKVSYKKGSKTVSILQNTCSTLPVSGLRLNHAAFPPGSYVTNATKSELFISAAAVTTSQEGYLFNQRVQKDSKVH